MLEHLRKAIKFINGSEDPQLKEVISMTTEKDQTALVTDSTTAELTAQLSTVTESLATLQASFAELTAANAELTAQYDAAQAALAASADAQATLVAQAKAKVLEARTASLTAVMGDIKGPQMAASLESLDDATFATVLSGYVASFEAEENSEMFTEKGVAAEVPPVVEVDVVKALAASIAAKFEPK